MKLTNNTVEIRDINTNKKVEVVGDTFNLVYEDGKLYRAHGDFSDIATYLNKSENSTYRAVATYIYDYDLEPDYFYFIGNKLVEMGCDGDTYRINGRSIKAAI